jgi:hypothetical protein
MVQVGMKELYFIFRFRRGWSRVALIDLRADVCLLRLSNLREHTTSTFRQPAIPRLVRRRSFYVLRLLQLWGLFTYNSDAIA